MDRIILLVLFLTLSGCSTWLRYDYKTAISNLPAKSEVILVTNSYVEYWIDGEIYLAYYSTKGEIIKTEIYVK